MTSSITAARHRRSLALLPLVRPPLLHDQRRTQHLLLHSAFLASPPPLLPDEVCMTPASFTAATRTDPAS
eukprot:7707534-Pyramimonas_sp.AAC.1